jgi:hypothetical protein
LNDGNLFVADFSIDFGASVRPGEVSIVPGSWICGVDTVERSFSGGFVEEGVGVGREKAGVAQEELSRAGFGWPRKEKTPLSGRLDFLSKMEVVSALLGVSFLSESTVFCGNMAGLADEFSLPVWPEFCFSDGNGGGKLRTWLFILEV